MAKIPINEINERAALGYINITKHPSADLYIYNYSKSCLFAHAFDEITELCRGIICDKDNNIVARPFKKFYNYEEICDKVTFPNLPFEAFEKLDGSLGIMYWIGDTPYISTRGSFTSEQAIHATEVLHSRYAEYFHLLDRNKTYLFEIVYPGDAHVVKYYDIDDIFLIAVINTETEAEDNIEDWNHIFKTPQKYDGVSDFTKIRDMFSDDNREGFVIKFSNNFRVKLKYESYFKLFNAINYLTEKRIFEALVAGDTSEIESALKQMDEESNIFYNNTVKKFKDLYSEIVEDIKTYYKDFDSDKEAAQYFLQFKNISGVLFNMRRGKDFSPGVWKLVREKFFG